jgi:hypothetical protein
VPKPSFYATVFISDEELQELDNQLPEVMNYYNANAGRLDFDILPEYGSKNRTHSTDELVATISKLVHRLKAFPLMSADPFEKSSAEFFQIFEAIEGELR